MVDRPFSTTFLIPCAFTVILLSIGCRSNSRNGPEIYSRMEAPEEWREPSPVGKVEYSVTIDLGEQRAYLFRNRDPIDSSMISTGKPGYRTPTGTFSIIEKVVDKRSNLYGQIVDQNGNILIADADVRDTDYDSALGEFLGAPMPYWMRLTPGGIGMHAGPIPLPARPVSHGCIRLPERFARKLFRLAPEGTTVVIRR